MSHVSLLPAVILPLIFCKCGSAFAGDAQALAMSGRNLTAEDVTRLEQQLVQTPTDVDSRTKLLGYYFLKQFRNKSASTQKQKHVLWLIQNSPDAQVLGLPYGHLNAILQAKAYEQGKRIWLDHINQKPKNVQLLGNSANYFLNAR